MAIKKITVDNCLETLGYYSFPSPVVEITYDSGIDDSGLASGTYGTIYDCKSINGVSVSLPLVVKIFSKDDSFEAKHSYDTTIGLQNAVNNYNNSVKLNGKKSTHHFKTLNGLPILSYMGKTNKNVKGYLMLKFDNSYIEFLDIIERNKDNSFVELSKLDFKYRLKFCLDLVEGFSILQDSKISFIHADINPSNFFLSLKTKQLIIIDYDSGALTTSNLSDPQTFGKVGDGTWMAPEVFEQNKNNSPLIKLDIYSDLWSIATAIHYILVFGFDPYYFLNTASAEVIKNKYQKKYTWPVVDKSNSIFRVSRKNKDLKYKDYEEYIKNIPDSILSILKKTFQDGYFNKSKRPTLYQWETVLKAALSPPKIDSFNISSLAVLSDEDFIISWGVQGTNKVILYPLNIDVSNKISYICSLKKDTTFYIEATNDVGISEKSKEIKVQVNPGPKIIFPTTKYVAVRNRSLTIDWKNQHVSKILLKDSNNVLRQDLGNANQFTFSNLLRDSVFIFEAIGKYGGVCKQKVEIRVFEEVKIVSFYTTRLEYIDSENILLDFAFSKAKSAIISDSDGQIFDVYTTNRLAFSAINVSKNTKDISFELKVTGHGNDIQTQKISNIKIYAKPKFEQIKLSPGQKLLFPEKLKVSFRTICVEEIIVQYGNNVLYANPNKTLEIDLTQSDSIFFTPVGKLGHKGEVLKRTIQVFHPIEIELFSNNRVTYPHIPITLTWKVINAQKLILNPGNIDISKLSSFVVQINQDTTFSIQASNDRHQATKEIRVGILAYPKVPPEKFVRIPQNVTKPMYEVIKELPINQQMFDYKKVDAFLREGNGFEFSKFTNFLNRTQTTIRRDFLRLMAKEFRNIYRSIQLKK